MDDMDIRHICMCGRDFDNKHGLRIHQSKSKNNECKPANSIATSAAPVPNNTMLVSNENKHRNGPSDTAIDGSSVEIDGSSGTEIDRAIVIMPDVEKTILSTPASIKTVKILSKGSILHRMRRANYFVN